MIKFLDLQKNYLSIKDEVDRSIINNITNSQFISGNDKSLFEKEFAEFIGTKYCVGVANGTDALELGIQSLGLMEGDEIITQPNSYIATSLGISYNKLKPVFVDINKDTMMIDHTLIEQKITSKTKALCIVHLYGLSPNMDEIIRIVQKHNLLLIEDCAQSHGSKYNDKRTGTFGDISCFSFYPGKNLGCYGDGGAICTNNKIYYDKLKLLHNLGSAEKYYHKILGRNSRLDTVQAGVLRIKLKHLDNNNMKRMKIAERYMANLQDCTNVKLPSVEANCTLETQSVSNLGKKELSSFSHTPVWHLFVVQCYNNSRDKLQQFLKENNIDTIIHYPIPIHKQEAYSEYNMESYPVTEVVASQILSLPMYPELTVEEVDIVCSKIKEFYN
jgi:dTDP-4-amino-4,6-dideoxygalactose transaminase